MRAYTFDGLGRLVRTQRQALDDFGDPTILSTRFYYDGVRRIQEVVGDDVAPAEAFMAGGGGGGDPQLEALAETIAIETMEASSGTPLDTTTAPIALEQGQLAAAQAIGGGGGPPPDSGPSREYVWGPGDNGLDELLVQFDSARTALYILQDAGGDIVAAAQRSDFEFWTTVASQYTFDAYGCVQTSEIFAPHAPLHAGHKGLFFDRLDDTAPFDPATGEAHSLIPFTQHLYHVRNRSYCPQLGRWMQRDPNATGMTVAETSSCHGRVAADPVTTFAPDQVFGDGLSLYQYLGSDGWDLRDPLGLSIEDFDEYIEEGLDLIPSFAIEAYARVGYFAYTTARDLTTGYSDNLSADTEWALNWDLDDDLHSRNDAGWVNDILGAGANTFVQGTDPTGGLLLADSAIKKIVRKLFRFRNLVPNGPGQWVKARGGSKARASRYQAKITKRPGYEYQVGKVRFDGYSKGGAHIEAKGPGYEGFLNNSGQFRVGVGKKVEAKLADQMARQRGAVGSNARIVWHVAERRVKDALQPLANRSGIILVHTPD